MLCALLGVLLLRSCVANATPNLFDRSAPTSNPCQLIQTRGADVFPRSRNPCDQYQPYISELKAHPVPLVTSFCSSLLGYPYHHATKTVSETRTETSTSVVQTKTTTVVDEVTTTITRTVVTTSTVRKTTTRPTITLHSTVLSTETTTETSTYPPTYTAAKDRVKRSPSYPVSFPFDKEGNVFPSVGPAYVSAVCSCLVSKPTSTVTKTVTQTTEKDVTAYQTTTKTATTTHTLYTTRTKTTTSTKIHQPFKTVTRTRNTTFTRIICTGKNPTPSFKMQLMYQPATVTGPSAGLFATTAPENALLNDETDALEFVANVDDATSYNIDCLGRLYSGRANGGNEQFGNTDNFPCFSQVFFSNQTSIDEFPSKFIYCDINPEGFLECHSHNPNSRLKYFQICEDFTHLYGSSVAMGNYHSTDSPRCDLFHFKAVPL